MYEKYKEKLFHQTNSSYTMLLVLMGGHQYGDVSYQETMV